MTDSSFKPPRGCWSERIRRLFDVAVSVVALLALVPLFAITAILIKLESRGPAFFRQERVGKDGKVFTIWKFRSMVAGSDQLGMGAKTGKGDGRITRVGRLLRASSFDELPQLINVLIGHMTFVGPRPTLPYQVERYGNYERRRLEVRPGITSLASTSGRNRLSWQQRIDLDIWYVEHKSVLLDLKILIRTVWVAFVTRDGVYADGEANDDFISTSAHGTRENPGC